MGKQSKQPTQVSQAEFTKGLDQSLEILLKDGASDQEFIDYTNDYKSRFVVAKPTPKPSATTQKKNPNQNGVSNLGNGSSDSQKIDPKTGFPKIDTNGPLPNFEEMKTVAVPPKNKESQSKAIFKEAKSKVDSNLTEERLQTEKDQSGFLNTVGKAGKAIWNVTGEALGAVNETFGGDSDYFTIDEYKPLQDQKKQYIDKAKRDNLPTTPEAIQKGAEDIFRQEDKVEQLKKNIDAALPEDYDREGIWKDLKLENLKKNDALRQAVITADVYQKQIADFDKFSESIKNVPQGSLSKTQIDTYNDLLTDAKESQEGLGYLQDTFPKLLKEVKTSDELTDVFKYNYNDYERAYSNIKNFGTRLGYGTLKIAAETASYIDEKTDEEGSAPTSADKTVKKVLQATKDVANDELDQASQEREQFISYKAKDINNIGDFGSYMTDLGTNQLPVYLTLAVAPEFGSALLGTSSAGDQFRNMEKEEMQPFAKQTSFGQKLATSYIYGAAETLFEKLGTVKVLKNIEQSIARASNGSRRLMRESVLSSVNGSAKRLGYNTFLEGGTEYLTAEAQIQADRNIAGKEVSAQKANENRFESFAGGALMGNTMTIAGGLWGVYAQQAKLYSDSQDIKKTTEILSKIDGLSDELKNNPNLTKQDKDIIHKKMTDLAEESFGVVTKNAEKGKTFSKEESGFLVAVNLMHDGLKKEFDEVKNSNLSTEQKEQLTKDLNDQFNSLEKNRNATLQGEFNAIPDIEKNIVFERANHDNPKLNGITPLDDDAQTETTPPAPEGQPQAEGEKVDEIQNNPEIDVSKAVVFESSNGGFFIADEKANHLETDSKGERVLYKTKEEAEAKLDQIKNPPVVEQTTTDTKEPASEDSPVPSVSEGFKTAGEDAKSKQDGKVLGRWILDNSKKGDTLTLKDGTGYEITDSKDGMVEIVPFETNENGEREYSYSGTRLVTENQLKQGDLFELVYTDTKGERITEQYSYNEATPPVENLTDEEALDGLDETEEDTPTETKPVLEELTDQEYLDFVENDFLSDERLNDIATKVLENKDLTTYEKRIAKKKEKEIVDINKKVQDEANETNRKAEVDTLSKIPAMEKDEFLEYTNTEKASEERLNSIAYKTANNVELNSFEAEVYQDNKKAVDKLNKTKNLKENILDKVPSEQKYTTKEGKYTVAKNGKELDLYDNAGQPVTLTPATKQKYFLEALENGFMKRNDELQYPEGITEEEANRFELENETDPSVILEKLQNTEIKLDGANASDFKDFAIASFINKVTQSSFVRFGDKNAITRGIALTYFSKEGQPIDTLAQEISESMDIEVTPQDIVDFILANPNGKGNILTVKNPEYQNLIDKFVSLTGFRPTPSQIMNFNNKEVTPTQIDIEFANEVEVNDETLELIDLEKAAKEFDKWFSNLTPQEQVEFYFGLEQDYPNAYYQQRYNEQQEYEQSKETTSTGTPNSQGKSKPDGSVGKNEQQDQQGSGNNNVPKRESGETQNEGVKIDKQQLIDKLIEVNYAGAQNNIVEFYTGIAERYLNGDKRIVEVVNEKLALNNTSKEEEYKSKTVEELVALKKELYPNPDIESPMSADEKLLEKVIARKFADINQAIKEKQKAKEAEAPKAEPKQSKRKIRDEKADKKLDDAFKDLRDELGKMFSGVNPELIIKGVKIITIYTQQGVYKFADIIQDAYEKFGEISKEMFDALKQAYASHYVAVEDAIADQMDSNLRSVTYESIIDKIQENETAEQPIEEKPITDTKPIELKTKAIEIKTDKLANDREAKIPAERKLEIANELLFDIDNEIENVNDQLRLLGAYEPSANDEMRENPHIYVERELKKDLTNFVKKLNERLKWEFDTDKKGKPIVASANIAPAGGDGTFILWVPNSEYGIYVSLSVQPKEYKEWYEKYELEPSILWRVTKKDNKYSGLSNQWMNSEDFTIPNLVDKFTKATTFYLKQENGSAKQQSVEPSTVGTLQPNSKRPIETTPQELLPKSSAEQGTGSRSKSKSNAVSGTTTNVGQSQNGQGDLFSGNADVLSTEEKGPTETKPVEKSESKIEKINQAEKQEPALVDFSLQDNEQDKFNATKKYTDNINALETLLTIIKEKRNATPEEKNILARYVGFGGLKEIAFNPDNQDAWKESTTKYKEQVRKVIELTQELDKALGINNSLSEIRAGILTAHYTPKTIIDTMFNVLGKLGFKNGNILEPSAGIGNFIGYMPSKMRSNSSITAVELDNLTGNILKYLYDDANTQITGIQNALIANNSQDVVISNVPFGNFKIFDKDFKGPREFLTKRIHNYFFAKALDKVREGGIVMFVTSKGVLDSKGNQNVREYLHENADFLGAVRLPSTVFQNNANTSVVTDIIILRKNTTGEKKNPNFIDVVDLEVTDKNGETKTITINKFFAENKNVLLGDIVPGGMYSEKDYSLADPDNKMGQIWERVSEMLDQHKGTFQPTTSLNATNRIETDQDLLQNTKNGNITISKEGKIIKRIGAEFLEVSMPKYVKAASVTKYIDIRNALFDLILAEYSGESDVLIDKLRQRLNFAYTTKRSISAKEFERIATEDGDGFNVLALENEIGERADIFTKRTINPLQQKQNTDSIDEAIIISLYENAKVDMDRIAELMNKPVIEIMEVAKGKIFESPIGGFFTRDEYLSGNVKKKLAEVNKAIESGYAEFENNKIELEAVLPKDIPAVSIEVRLGSRWVPLDVINDFTEHLFKGDNVVVNYMKSTDTYNNNGKAHSVNASEKWGTKRKNGADLLIDALHAATPAIYDTIDDKRVLNKEETEKAVQKFEEIRAEFENWIYTNAERRERLGAIYNEKYNTTVRRKYDGSHLNIPGISGVNLYPHQKDAIWMLLQNNGGIIDHIVGAGKTFVMVAGTAEMKRTGVAKKPMILALKSTIPQIVETYKQSYPLAKILAPSEKDFQSKNRQKLFSQISINDWDVIIMSHENFNAIPHRIENLTKQIADEIAEIEEERDALSNDKKALSGLEKRLQNLEARLEKLTDIAKDNSVKFQEMGIDHVMVDESQQFKNLAYMTKQRNVAGLSKAEGSRRAFNLLVGMRYLQDVFGADKGTTFLSGTPISNSMVEMYSLLKYMRPNKMKELGFNTFDQWATTFASPTNEVEYTVTGQFKSKTRFREFINVPELSLLYNEIADVRNDSNLVLDKPKMKGGGYTTMFIPMNEEQADYGQRIIQFAKTKDGSVLGLQLSENQLTAYMLLATNLSSKMAIDMRLINKDFAYDPNGKVGKMTDEVVKVYNETNEHKGAQLIFSDLGTPKNKNNQSEMLKDYMEDELGVPQDTLVEIFGNFAEEGHRYQPFASIKQKAIDVLEIEETDFTDYVEQARQSGETFNLYSEIKARLIEKGIPENEIVFIHSYNNQKAKEKLFEQVNAGEIRVILGSTQKLGTGVNVQKRLAAIHHLDVPWRPSDMEQRNGRGVRQGNWIAKTHLNNEIGVYAYATERTLDGYKYQLLQTKQRFLDQVKNGDIEDRVIKENSEEGSDAYAIFVAELSGNKDILLKFKLEQEKERLTKQRRNFEGSLYEAQGNIRKLESSIPAMETRVSQTEKDIESITNKAEYDVTKDDETGIETKKLKINNINGEVLQPEKDSKEAKEKKPVDRIEYGKKAMELIAKTVKTIKLAEFTKSFEINGLPILVRVDNFKEMNNGKEFIVQRTYLAILAPTGDLYDFKSSTIPGVLLNNLQKAIEGIPDHISNTKYYLEQNKKDLADYKEFVKNDKFPKEEELSNVAAELREIDKRIQDFEKDPEEDAENIEEKPQDNKIRIGDAVYPNFNEDVDVSIVEGKNLKTNEANYLVKVNKQLDYQSEYKKVVEPLFLENGGEWNKSHKAIIFADQAKAKSFVNEISKTLNLGNDLDSGIRFQLGEQKAFETNNNTKATKENLQQEFPDAIVVQSESELPTSIQREIRQQKAEGKVQGVYNNGDVYLVADNIKTIGEATGTYRHETLGHKGVIEHLGNKLNDYSTRIIDNAKGGQLRKLQELAARYGLPTDLNSLTLEQKQLLGEEYIAMISENKSQYPQAWNDLVSFIRETLRKLGINLQVTIAEIQALIGKVESNNKAKNENKSTAEKTRFNIVGENANFKNDSKDNLVTAKELEAKGTSTKEIWIATGWEKGIDGKWRAEIDNSKMELDPEFMQMRGYTLGEAIKYDELFELYPEIKDVRVSVIPNLGNMLGAYMPTKNIIILNGQRTEEEIRSTLLHEIQHIVQGKEGFATGGTSKMAENYLRKKISKISISKNIPSFLAKAANKLSSSLLQGININSSKEEFNAELNKAKDLLSKDVFDLYQSIAGEVESRNVQERMNMTNEEKAMTPLVETEDVSREEQIVLMNNEKGAFFAENTNNKPLRLPQTIARQALDQIKEDTRNKVDKKTILNNAVAIVQDSDWYNDLDDIRKARVNNTTVKSLLENAIKEINYLEDKVEEYKQKLKENKLTTREVFNDIVAFLQTNKIKGKITPTEVNRLIKAAVQITVKRDTEKALDDFMNLYEVIKEKALLRSDKGAREKAEVDYVLPIVEGLVASGYDLDAVLDYFETNSQKRMAEIQYHKEKSKFATEEERVNKAEEALEKQKQDLFNATYTSFREGLKKARLYWFNLIDDRSYVPAELMSKTGMQQTYYQFKNTKGYGHSAKEMYERVYDKVWKGLTQNKIQLLHDAIQMMRIISIDNNREQNGLAPVQHPNNLSKIDAQSWLDNQKSVLGQKEFNDIQKRANEYFKAYTAVLDLKMENGFISEETYDALNGLDYQPRMFLHHAVNFDGDLSFEKTKSIETRSGLSKEQVLKLDDGSANSLISDAQWLLSNSISTLYQDIADNTLNQLFIAKELPIAQAKYDELLEKTELTKEESRFIKYFKELSDKVIPNEIIGFSANNNNPVYKNEAPKHFVNKYYWDNGVKHQFFMEEKLAQEFDGAKGVFLNETNKQVVGNITGSRLVKWFATGNNPLFVIVNTPRDFMWNILVSEHYSSVVPLAMAQMTYQLFPSTYDFIRTKLGRENTDMNLYLQHGGSMDYLHKQGDIADKSFADKYIVKTITSVFGKNNQPIVEDKIRNNYLIKGVNALNEWSELAFRIATFRRSINAQLKDLGFNNESEITDLIDENGVVTQTQQEILDNVYRKATYDARSILDFSQGGRLIKDMEEFVPYLNVGVQATRSYADAMKKRPISTTLKTLQIATGGAAAFIALAMFMLAGDDDEPEEEKGKTVERKYVEFMQGVSEETRSKYYLIPTKQRDENGNRIANKIAKDQLLIPYTNIVETLIENKIRTRAGFKEVSGDKIRQRLYKDIFEYNLSAKTIKDVPLFKAGTAWYAGYDLYRNKPLDKYAKTEALEGMNNPQVEDFYKHLGEQWKLSPIRTKSAIESMITSPQSNPYIATGYEVMDYAFTDKTMENLGKGVKDMLLKGLKNRTTTKSTEWTRAESLLSDSKKEQLNTMLKEEATRQLFKDKAQEVIDGKATAEEVVKDLQSQYGSDPNYRSYMKSFKTTRKGALREEGTDGMMQRIKREKSPGAKAIMIREIYGDINSPENKELKEQLIGKRIINNATLRYLEKKAANQ
jgi:N12 class adenine-specific DNA methylase